MKLLFIIISFVIVTTAVAQQPVTSIKLAKTSYMAGKLEEAHSNLQTALQQLDILIAKDVLQLLPLKLDSLQSNVANDDITANEGFAGTSVERNYGNKQAEVNVTINSPIVAMLNSYLNNPALAQFNDGNTKIIKLQGYKAKLEKRENGTGGFEYEINVPLGSSVVVLKVNNSSEEAVIAMANSMPLQKLAKLVN